jgi:hypothetical protein
MRYEIFDDLIPNYNTKCDYFFYKLVTYHKKLSHCILIDDFLCLFNHINVILNKMLLC